ncbi:MAG TPA: hypothetical protein VFF79_09520 [Conexibacter sp.]|nr:hypothetical protein [Conexibacter sp.]
MRTNLLLAEHLDHDPRSLTNKLLRTTSKRLGRQLVTRRVLQITRTVLRLSHNHRDPHRPAHVIVRTDQQRLQRTIILRMVAITIEAIPSQHRALHQPGHDRIVDIVGDLPTQHRRPQLAAARVDGGCDDPRTLSIERRTPTEPDDDPAAVLGVRERQVPERATRLTAVEQALERPAGDVVHDILAVEHADRDRVSGRLQRPVGRRRDTHPRQITRRRPAGGLRKPDD